MAEDRPEVCTFQLDSDYGWDDGLICGGRMKIVVEPIAAGSQPSYFRQLSELIERGEGCTEAMVFDSEASGLEAPAAVLFDRDGRLTDFTAGHTFTEKEACSPDFLDRFIGNCRVAAPFTKFLTDALGLPF